MTRRAATGSNTLVAIGEERHGQWGVPEGNLLQYGVSLPVAGRLAGSMLPSGQVNPSGYRRKRIPGSKGGPFEWGHPLTAGHMLPFLLHILGAATRETIEPADPPLPAVYRYVVTPPGLALHANTSFWGLASSPPHVRWLLYGIMLGTLTLEMADEGVVVVRLAGESGHGTKWGLAEPKVGNTGTYTLGPWLRGVAVDPTLPVWIRIQTEWVGATPPTFKMLQSANEPIAGAWTAATHIFTVLMDEEDRATWQNLQSSSTGLDAGLWTENKDPLEFILPGLEADHTPLAVGDIFKFDPPAVWENPALVELTGHTRMTTAHWVTRFRAEGATDWITRGGFTGTLTLEQALKVARGNPSRYPTDMYREGELVATLELARDLLDTIFEAPFERHGRLEAQHVYEGPQLASGQYRESLQLDFPALNIDEYAADPSDEAAVEETVTLGAETNDDGDPPITATVITTRLWENPAVVDLDT